MKTTRNSLATLLLVSALGAVCTSHLCFPAAVKTTAVSPAPIRLHPLGPIPRLRTPGRCRPAYRGPRTSSPVTGSGALHATRRFGRSGNRTYVLEDQSANFQPSCVSRHAPLRPPLGTTSGTSSGGTNGSHGPAGGLDLSTYSGVMSKVVAGDPERSTLYQYIRGAQMPPQRQLPEEQILAIQNWIEAGAKNN